MMKRVFVSAFAALLISASSVWAVTSTAIWVGNGQVSATNPLPVTGSLTGGGAVTIGSGGVASGAFASGALSSGSIVDGAIVTLGAKADAKSSATDTTAVTAMQVWKQISASVQSLVTQLSNPLPVSGTITANSAAATTGGCTPYHFTSAGTTNSTSIKASAAATLCSLSVVNTTATIYYLRLYDSAGAPTCSSATGAVASYPIPASASGAGIAPSLGPFGVAFTNGIGFCLTASGGDTANDSAATGIYLNASYK